MERIAVLGGGPGGAAAALQLARAGADVTLYAPEKRGEKPCGGGLPTFILPHIEGFDSAGLEAVPVGSVLVENSAGLRVEVEARGLSIFRRGDLDPALTAAARAAGARYVAAKARLLEWQGGRPAVVAGGERRLYDWVIDAAGARSLGRRTLGLEPVGESVGLGASVPGIEARRMVLGVTDVADAYTWIFPRPGGASVGVAYSAAALSDGAARALLAAFLDRHLPGDGGPPPPRYRYPIPVYGPWTLEAVGAALERRLLLVGDAAAVADPLTREGIRYAVLTGVWAAESLLAGRPGDYRRRVEAELDGEMRRAHRATELFFHDSVAQWMVPVCRFHPGVRRVLQDLLSCRQPYRGLRRRLLRAAVGAGGPSPGGTPGLTPSLVGGS